LYEVLSFVHVNYLLADLKPKQKLSVILLKKREGIF
jgi:hypothetical protein